MTKFKTGHPSQVRLSGAISRREEEDGYGFRHRAYGELSQHYRSIVDRCMSLIVDATSHLEFDSMRQVHALQLRRPLLERHSLPFLLTHDSFFPDTTFDHRVLAACLVGHTLALTHLDYHLDGAPPSPRQRVSAVKVAPASAVSYAVRMIYLAGAIGSETSVARELSRDVFEPVSGFVISRMHEDWITRFDFEQLMTRDAADLLNRYTTSPTSRLLGSGYWEVMARAAYIEHLPHSPIPDHLVSFSMALRRLRQIGDELEDVEEDLLSGLMTAPTLYALNDEQQNGRTALRDDIVVWWQMGAPIKSGGILPALASRVFTARVGMYMAQRALEAAFTALDAVAHLVNPEQAPLLEVLVWLKLAKIEALLVSRYALPYDAELVRLLRHMQRVSQST